MKITTPALNEGKLRLKRMSDSAKATARSAIEQGGSALEDYHEIMFFNQGLREKHLESLIIAPDGDVFPVLLILSGAPRGMANVIAAPRRHALREDADVEALMLLTAAWVAILETKAEINAGTFDQHFNFRMVGGLVLSIPHEIMSMVANRIPAKIDAPTKDVVLKRSLTNMNGIFTGELNVDTWNGLDDRSQGVIMEAACGLLCIGHFEEAAARAA